MKQLSIIEPSESPWAVPVVLTPKRNGTLHYCIDNHNLNQVTQKDSYPLPNVLLGWGKVFLFHGPLLTLLASEAHRVCHGQDFIVWSRRRLLEVYSNAFWAL